MCQAYWKIEWRDDHSGQAVHEPSGVVFNVARSGWVGVVDPHGAPDLELRRLMSELVIHLGLLSDEAAMPDTRLLH